MIGVSLAPFALKGIFGALVAFFAILAWSKTRDAAWTCIASAVIIRFAGEMIDMLCSMNLLEKPALNVFGVPLIDILLTAIPAIFFIAAFSFVIYNS